MYVGIIVLIQTLYTTGSETQKNSSKVKNIEFEEINKLHMEEVEKKTFYPLVSDINWQYSCRKIKDLKSDNYTVSTEITAYASKIPYKIFNFTLNLNTANKSFSPDEAITMNSVNTFDDFFKVFIAMLEIDSVSKLEEIYKPGYNPKPLDYYSNYKQDYVTQNILKPMLAFFFYEAKNDLNFQNTNDMLIKCRDLALINILKLNYILLTIKLYTTSLNESDRKELTEQKILDKILKDPTTENSQGDNVLIEASKFIINTESSDFLNKVKDNIDPKEIFTKPTLNFVRNMFLKPRNKIDTSKFDFELNKIKKIAEEVVKVADCLSKIIKENLYTIKSSIMDAVVEEHKNIYVHKGWHGNAKIETNAFQIIKKKGENGKK